VLRKLPSGGLRPQVTVCAEMVITCSYGAAWVFASPSPRNL